MIRKIRSTYTHIGLRVLRLCYNAQAFLIVHDSDMLFIRGQIIIRFGILFTFFIQHYSILSILGT